MNAKKLGKIENQPGISTFVGKAMEKTTKSKLENTGASESSKRTSLEPHKKNSTKEGVKASTVRTTGSKKRSKPENNSPDNDCKQPSKKKTTTMSNQTQNKNNKEDNGEMIILKPELQELKRQIFAGFEELIEPLKKDIQDLKSERETTSETLNVETVVRKFERSDKKHKRLEERLSLIEDQLLLEKFDLPRNKGNRVR